MLFEALSRWVLFRENWAISTNGNRIQPITLSEPGWSPLPGGYASSWQQKSSKLLDRSFRFHQDRDAIANGINALAFIALQAVFATRHERLATNWAGKNFQQFWADHDDQFYAALRLSAVDPASMHFSVVNIPTGHAG